MKKTLMLLGACQLMFVSVFAQSVQVDTDAGVNYGIIEDAETGWQLSAHVSVTNISASDEDYWVSQEVLSGAGETEFYFCWGTSCYTPNDPISLESNNLTAGEEDRSMIAYARHKDSRMNVGYSAVKYCVYSNVDNSDSTCTIIHYGLGDKIDVAGDVDNNGIIDEGEVCGDLNEDGSINNGEISGDWNGDSVIDGDELIGDVNGDLIIDGGEKWGDANGDGIINNGEVLISSVLNQVNNNVKVYYDANKVFIEGVTSGTNITIVGISGAVVYKKAFNGSSINVSSLKKGIYFVKVADSVTKIRID